MSETRSVLIIVRQSAALGRLTITADYVVGGKTVSRSRRIVQNPALRALDKPAYDNLRRAVDMAAAEVVRQLSLELPT